MAKDGHVLNERRFSQGPSKQTQLVLTAAIVGISAASSRNRDLCACYRLLSHEFVRVPKRGALAACSVGNPAVIQL